MQIVLLIIMLLWPVVGCAKHTEQRLYTLDEVKHGAREALAEIAPQIRQNRDCLERMEAAMRAMDGYLNTFLSNEQRKETRLVFTPHGLKEFERKMTIWDDVARDCWKETP